MYVMYKITVENWFCFMLIHV